MTATSQEDENKLSINLPLFGAFSWMVVNTLTATNKTNILVCKNKQKLTKTLLKSQWLTH